MATQKAVVITEPKVSALVTDRRIPALRDDYILVKTVSVGLNPTDWKHIEQRAPPGVVVGCDYAGIVEAVGKDVKKPFRKGDRVCGVVHGCNAVQPEDGAFAEYLVAKGDLQMKMPDSLSFEEGATLGVGVLTVALALYQKLDLALPTQPAKETSPILIYGGSTATGTLAIQFAKLSGYTVYTTCSPHNFDLMRRLGADAVFDYKDPQSGAAIRKATDNKLGLIMDCIGNKAGVELCDNALSSDGGKYTTIVPATIDRPGVENTLVFAYTAIGEAFKYGEMSVPEKLQDKEHWEKFVPIVESLLEGKKFAVHPPRVGKDGLKGVLDGLELLKSGQVSGEKLVYNVKDTP
ncbi:Protein TOXD [Penicillium capsulatum]|uniref:Protein TOXD n=1 Tax=Penicillium capsulatum TaxID=69766 RepID=A0A9W9M1A3_9EURO|nr:Protein TOXD [Penicillium capsulatum]KAJ6129364.1 Protein TOXD [Penicillium capsulatum]